ncbi:MAG: DUF2344 domain-containing protein [Ruthenibacterium lactatiformans]
MDFKSRRRVRLGRRGSSAFCVLPGALGDAHCARRVDAGDIACAAYEVRYAEKDAQAACAAWEAYNAAPAAEVVKEGKRGKKKTVDLKAHLPEVQLMRKNGGLVVCMRLPAGSVLNVNPVLVLGWLEQQHGLPAASGNILRTGIYTRNGEKFS